MNKEDYKKLIDTLMNKYVNDGATREEKNQVEKLLKELEEKNEKEFQRKKDKQLCNWFNEICLRE